MQFYRDDDSWHDVMLVCEKGHQITSSLKRNPDYNVARCSKCGSKTLSKCSFCNEDIRGKHHVSGVISISKVPLPEFCHNCGKPYPWSGKAAVSTKENQAYDPITFINIICDRFQAVARQLQNRYENRETLEVNDEYDMQDLCHVLLKMFFMDIRTEEWTPSYAGKSSRMDFLLKNEEIVMETKKTRKGLGIKELGDELIIDIDRYKQHQNCKTLICFVYDPEGKIGNPASLEKDLSRKVDKLEVIVIVRPN